VRLAPYPATDRTERRAHQRCGTTSAAAHRRVPLLLYTIHHRAPIVEDRRGASYLFSRGQLHLRLRVP